jgi:hypothetical protein
MGGSSSNARVSGPFSSSPMIASACECAKGWLGGVSIDVVSGGTGGKELVCWMLVDSSVKPHAGSDWSCCLNSSRALMGDNVSDRCWVGECCALVEARVAPSSSESPVSNFVGSLSRPSAGSGAAGADVVMSDLSSIASGCDCKLLAISADEFGLKAGCQDVGASANTPFPKAESFIAGYQSSKN